MSRALTVFSRREAALQVDGSEVEKIMEKLGCSEPVAKNMIKYAKLGIGPLAGQGGPGDDGSKMSDRARRSQEDLPPRIDKKTAALIAEQKLRERQEAEEEAEMQRLAGKRKIVGLPRLGAVMPRGEVIDPVISQARKQEQPEELRGMFEQARPVAKKTMQIGGITQLKPIIREEEEEADPPERASGSKGDEAEEGENPYDKWMAEEAQKRQHMGMDKKRHQKEEDRHGKRKRKRGRSSEDNDDEARRNGKRLRSVSRGREDAPATGGSGSGGGLMSEAQVMKLMGKDKRQNKNTERGSVRAQSRILREKEEWEQRKANNPEFWKAPQFALCYSAETGKRARGAG